MQQDLFQYYLRKKNLIGGGYLYYYVDSNGVVQSSSTKTAIKYSPDGWEEQSIKWERGTTYYGVFTNYTNPLRFVKDGRKIIKTLFYNDGVNSICELLIEKHNNTLASYGYETYFIGDIDFSRFIDEKDFTQVEIMEQGFMSKLKSNEDTKYEIPVSASPDYWVKMDGYPLGGSANWTGLDNEVIDDIGTNARIPTMAFFQSNPYNLYLNFQTNSTQVPARVYFVRNMSNTISQDVNLVHNYYFNIYNKSTSPYAAYFTIQYIFTDALGVDTILDVYQAPTALAIGSSQTYLGTLTNTYTLAPLESISMVIRMLISPSSALTVNHWDADQMTGNAFKMDWLTKVPDTYVPCITQQTLGEFLANQIDGAGFTSAPATATEDYLLTSGDALRNLDQSKLKTSISDFFKASNSMNNIGMFFDGTDLRFEYKDDIFNSSLTPYDIGEVASIKVEPYTAELFSRLKIGYKPYEYDTTNGKEEFNIDYVWTTPLTRVQGEKNFISPYRADMYGIELVRANLIEKTNADSDNDNDIFWIHADLNAGIEGTIPAGYQGAGEPYYRLFRNVGLTITGLISPTDAYNIELSPKRRMYAMGNYLVSCLTPYTSSVLSFASSSKTQNGAVYLVTDDGSTIIDEQLNETIGDLSTTPNFIPYLATIEVKIPVNLRNIFETITGGYSQSFGAVQFSYKGNSYQGYIIMATDSPTYRPKQQFKLLLTPSNNITDLINGI